MIVIGLGSGRSGTASLAKLLNAQQEALCFHEMNPSCVRFEGTPRPILNMIEEFGLIASGGETSRLTVDLARPVSAAAYDRLCAMPRVRLIGDIAFYYLSYVELIAAHNPKVRFVCLKRDKTATVESWLRHSTIRRWPSKRLADRLSALITRQKYYTHRNPWVAHDGSRWEIDPVWDKCFPKMKAGTRRGAIEQYWDYYYGRIDRIAEEIPERLMIVETETLQDREAQSRILSFCGYDPPEHVYTQAHIHQSA
jgi:hypothetical protein